MKLYERYKGTRKYRSLILMRIKLIIKSILKLNRYSDEMDFHDLRFRVKDLKTNEHSTFS